MSTYIKLSTLEYPRHIGDIQIDPAGMADYAEVQWIDQPKFNPARERCNIATPTKQGDVWVTNWEVTPIPDEEEAAKVRSQRNTLLADWVDRMNPLVWEVMTDEEKQECRNFRQALLDLSDQPGFPWDVTFPKIPTVLAKKN